MLALSGMSLLLKENKNIKLITEVFPNALKKAGASAEEYLNQLSEMEFELNYVDRKTGSIEPITLNDAIKKCYPKNASQYFHFDLLCQR